MHTTAMRTPTKKTRHARTEAKPSEPPRSTAQSHSISVDRTEANNPFINTQPHRLFLKKFAMFLHQQWIRLGGKSSLSEDSRTDCPPPLQKAKIFSLLIYGILIFSLLDFVTTLIGLALGASEANPLMSMLFNAGWSHALASKVIAVIIIISVLGLAFDYFVKREKEIGQLSIIAPLLINVLLVLIFLNNIIIVLVLAIQKLPV